MRVFALKPDDLRILDTALEGRLSHALEEVAREGGDPILGVERIRPTDGTPSSWLVLVSGGSVSHRFEVNSPTALGVAAQIYLRDHVTELTADLSAKVQCDEAAEQLAFDFRHPLPRQPGSGPPS